MESVFEAGEERFLGALAPTRSYAFPKYGASYAVKPRSEWWDHSLRSYCPTVYDQNGQGSCVGHGAAAGFTVSYNLAIYRNDLRFSPCYVYGLINGGRDQGAVVHDAMEVLKKGIVLESLVPAKKIWPRDWPSGVEAEAAKYRAQETCDCNTFDELVSAILENRPTVFGVQIGQAFNPDSSGVIPARRGAGGGHCMAGIGVKKIGSQWYIETLNSWGPSWGAGGYCFIPESYFTGELGHFAVITTTTTTDTLPEFKK